MKNEWVLYSNLPSRVRKMILPLVADAVKDALMVGVLADLLEDNGSLIGQELRDRPTLGNLVRYLSVGDWKAQAKAQRCRGAIRDAQREAFSIREHDEYGVEMDTNQYGILWLSPAERAAFCIPVEDNPNPAFEAFLRAAACSRRHCAQIVTNGLHDIPVPLEMGEVVRRLRLKLCGIIGDVVCY